MAAGDLITLAEARGFLNKQTTQTADDEVLTALVTRASEVVQRHLDTQLRPAATATYTLPWDGSERISLAPYVARSVTAVTLDPGESSATAISRYRTAPVPGTVGYWLELDGREIPAYTGNFGTRRAQVTGTWGFTEVPEAIKHACCVTLAAWYRREVATFTTVYNEVEGRVERPEALPSSVVRLLELYKRPVI